jgi:hypothetical protein
MPDLLRFFLKIIGLHCLWFWALNQGYYCPAGSAGGVACPGG